MYPKSIKKSFLAAGVALVALAAVSILILSIEGQYLLICNSSSGKAIFRSPAANGERFSVSFIHSVNKSPVGEHYEIRDGKIYLVELHYESFGAGMPTEPEGAQAMRIENGELIIDGFEREMPDLRYSIGRVANHILHFREADIPLNTLDEPGQSASFFIARHPRILAFLGLYPTDYLSYAE